MTNYKSRQTYGTLFRHSPQLAACFFVIVVVAEFNIWLILCAQFALNTRLHLGIIDTICIFVRCLIE